MVFRGYLDESYGVNQNIFAWSCLLGRGKDWFEVERKWKLHLAAKNKELKKSGRPLISRYHASDCSGRHGEFKGWTHDERDKFVLGLFGIFKQIPLHNVVFDVQLDELCDVFPEWSKDRIEAAYGLLTALMLYLIGQDFKHFALGPVKISLIHDQTCSGGAYDATILRAYNAQIAKPDFMYRDCFTTIAPMKWQDCIALQPADLVAFECYKEAEGRLEARKSRKSFKALLDMGAFGIHSKTINKVALHKLREALDQGREKQPKS